MLLLNYLINLCNNIINLFVINFEILPFLDLKNSPLKVRIVFHTFRVELEPLNFRVYHLLS